MPLPADFFELNKRVTDTQTDATPQPITTDLDFVLLTGGGETGYSPPPIDPRLDDILDADDRIPAGSLIKRETVIYQQYFREAELLGVDANTGCEYYRVHVEVARFIDHYVVFGPVDYFYLRVADGIYQLSRYVRNCPQSGVESTGLHDSTAIPDNPDETANDEGDTPTVARAKRLFRAVEGTDVLVNPPRSIPQPGAPQQPVPPPNGGDARLWRPPALLPRLFAAHGYTQAYDEGNDHILQEYFWQAGPYSITGCVMTVTYFAVIRVTRWTLNPSTPPDVVHGAFTSRTTTAVEPRLVTSEQYSIPGCDPLNPLGRRQ